MALPVKGKLIFDTNIFVSYLRAGLHERWIEGRIEETTRFLSSVVIFELRIGALDHKRVNAVSKLIRSFPKERVVTPTVGAYRRAAELFQQLFGTDSRSWPQDRLGSVHDILIAITAFRMGATVITENENDFLRIAHLLPGFRFSTPY